MNKFSFYDPNHQANNRFKNNLRKKVIKTYYQKEKNNMNTLTKVALSFGSLVLLAGVGFFAYGQLNDDGQKLTNQPQAQVNKLTELTVTPKYSTGGGNSSATSLPGGQEDTSPRFKSLNEAAKAAGIKPYYPSLALSGEVLTEVYVTEGLTGGSEKSLYASYGTAEKMAYQLIQTAGVESSEPLPMEVEKFELTVSGQKVVVMRNEFWNDQTPKSEVYPGTPRQSLSFTKNGVAVTLSEYGDISLNDLKNLIANLKQL